MKKEIKKQNKTRFIRFLFITDGAGNIKSWLQREKKKRESILGSNCFNRLSGKRFSLLPAINDHLQPLIFPCFLLKIPSSTSNNSHLSPPRANPYVFRLRSNPLKNFSFLLFGVETSSAPHKNGSNNKNHHKYGLPSATDLVHGGSRKFRHRRLRRFLEKTRRRSPRSRRQGLRTQSRENHRLHQRGSWRVSSDRLHWRTQKFYILISS